MRSGSRGGAVNGCVGGEHGADNRSAWGTNHDANKRINSARGAPQETGLRAGCGANAGPDGSAHNKADQGMLASLGAGGCRDADDVFAFYRDIGAVFFEGEQFIRDRNKFSGVALQAEFDDFEFTIDTQRGSSDLMKHCALGTHFKAVILHVRKAGNKSMEFLRYVFGSCIISSFSTSGDEESTDTIKFNYRAVATKYVPQDNKGEADTAKHTKGGYDLKKNQEWDGEGNLSW